MTNDGRARAWTPDAWWDGVWSWGALAVACTPLVALPLIDYGTVSAVDIAIASCVTAYVIVLFANLLFYLHWRLTDDPSGWLVLALTTLAVQSLALASLFAGDPRRTGEDLGWILVMQVIVAAGICLVMVLARRRTLRADPLLLGGAIGLLVVGVRRAVLSMSDPPVLSETSMTLLSIALLLADLAIVVAVMRLTVAPQWVRLRLGGSLGMLSIAQAASYSAANSVLLSIVTTAFNTLGAALLLTLAAALARNSWRDNRVAAELLARRLREVEAGARADQARLHELRATVAGLGTASRLVHRRSSIGTLRRQQLEDMITSEMDRLQRLLHETSQPRGTVDLDATISPIVLRHRIRGYPIDWTPSGARAMARADDVAEVVNVLLENAYQHAPHGSASIVTRESAGIVEIAVSDTGPGIDPAEQSRIFDWGERGGASRGSGIGLNVARQLTSSLGGYLRLVDSPVPGTTFVIGLPAEELR